MTQKLGQESSPGVLLMPVEKLRAELHNSKASGSITMSVHKKKYFHKYIQRRTVPPFGGQFEPSLSLLVGFKSNCPASLELICADIF